MTFLSQTGQTQLALQLRFHSLAVSSVSMMSSNCIIHKLAKNTAIAAPMATPSLCTYNLSTHMKPTFVTASSNNSRQASRPKLGWLSDKYRELMAITIASLTGTLVYKLLTPGETNSSVSSNCTCVRRYSCQLWKSRCLLHSC